MNKFLLTFCAFFAITLCFGQAKNKNHSATNLRPLSSFDLLDLNNTCDSIGWRPPSNYSVAAQVRTNNGGFFSGVNSYGDIAKGNFFDLSGTTANFLSRLIIRVAYANGANGGNLDKPVILRVLDGTSNSPGSQITSLEFKLEDMRNISGVWTIINFPANIQLPASKKVFIAVDFRELVWNTTPDAASKDTFLLAHTIFGEANPNLGWEQWSDESWYAMDDEDAWGGTMNFHLYPLVSATSDGCTLPVTFGGFTGKLETGGINLKWQTWTETANNRFEIERSADALKYTAIGTLKTKAENGNNQGLLSYQFTDKDPLPGVNFYRIRQIDIDGASEFSKTIKVINNTKVENSIVQSYYPNPVSDRLIIQLGNGVREVNALRFNDASGRVISAQRPAVSSDGIINVSTIGLRSGLNFATIILPDGQQSTIKVMKE